MRRPWFVSLIAVAAVVGCGGDADAPVDAAADAAVDAGTAAPTAADIRFVAKNALPSGSWLLYNDWSKDPNRLYALATTDLAGTPLELFEANRVWAFGARADGGKLLFSAWDADQEAHYGLTIGDSIQNTFEYDPATQAVRVVSWGNQSDECHAFTADGSKAYVCRRYDFTPEGAYTGWRLGALDLTTSDFEFLRTAQATQFELSPTPVPNTTQLLFELRGRPPAAANPTIWSRELTTGVETMIKASARRPTIAPDGTRLAFQNSADQSRWYVMDLGSPATPPTMISATTGVGHAEWAADGASLVYTVDDSANSCDDLEVVPISGMTVGQPTRVRRCTEHGFEFITNMAWVIVP